MAELWYGLLALVLSVYVVLDGFDLGAGILHLRVAKTDEEREAVLSSIGPVWDGNEVWLVVAGATFFLAFPAAFAAAFSGFYLPLTLVLWLLVFRALGIELRHQLHHRLWVQFWDAAFAGSSLLLALFFGAALGNVVRGVDLAPDGDFFLPLWTDFGVEGPVGILDWYTLIVAAHAVVALALHGALWLGLRTEGPTRDRSLALVPRLLAGVVALGVATTAATLFVQPRAWANLTAHPALFVVPCVAVAGLALLFASHRRGRTRRAFAGSCLYLLGMLGSAVLACFPYLLPGHADAPGLSLTDAAAPDASLATALAWWLPGMALATAYFVWLYRRTA